MTNEEAKNWLNKLYAMANITDEYGDMEDTQPYEEAVEMAIQVLAQEPKLLQALEMEKGAYNALVKNIQCEDAISRAEAINIIKNWLFNDTGYSWGEKNVMKCVINELRDLPSVSTENPNNCDSISRKWLKTAIHNFYYGLKHTPTEEDIQAYIDAAPSVSTEKTGRWIKIKPYPLQMHDYECSECKHETDDNTEKYCCECGCRMMGVEE